MEDIWIVSGSTGEYSDRSEWNVCAFRNEAEAKLLVEKLGELARQAVIESQDVEYQEWENTEAGKNLLKLDPHTSIDYTGTYYSTEKLQLRN